MMCWKLILVRPRIQRIHRRMNGKENESDAASGTEEDGGQTSCA